MNRKIVKEKIKFFSLFSKRARNKKEEEIGNREKKRNYQQRLLSK